MATTVKVLSQMESQDSAIRARIRDERIKTLRERNEQEQTMTFNTVINSITFLTMATIVILALRNPEAIKALWEKIAPYILL